MEKRRSTLRVGNGAILWCTHSGSVAPHRAHLPTSSRRAVENLCHPYDAYHSPAFFAFLRFDLCGARG